MNTIKTTLLLASMTGLFLAAGYLLGGDAGILIAFACAIVTNAGAYWFSDKLVLLSQGARPISQADAPDLYRIVERLASHARLPMPRIYVIPGPQPNAFATGRDAHHAAIAVTDTIVQLLTPSELEAVLGHELGHVRNHDILLSAVVATLAGAISVAAYMAQWALILGGFGGDRDRDSNVVVDLLLIFVAPFAALLIQLAISRSREYGADAASVDICGKPLALASALRKIEAYVNAYPSGINPSMAHLYIINPLRMKGIRCLFRSHPDTEDRIARLEAIAAKMARE